MFQNIAKSEIRIVLKTEGNQWDRHAKRTKLVCRISSAMNVEIVEEHTFANVRQMPNVEEEEEKEKEG